MRARDVRTGRADGEALAGGGRRVAEGVESVGALADFRVEVGLLGDGSGVVGDGAVGVGREGDAKGGEHADGGDGDAVKAGELMGPNHRRRDDEERNNRAQHARGEPADDDGWRGR